MLSPPQEAYLDVTLPVLGATLRALEAEHRQLAGEPNKKLQQRLKYLGDRLRHGQLGDAGARLGAGYCASACVPMPRHSWCRS